MSSPLIDSVRDLPNIYNMDTDEETGFPFDDLPPSSATRRTTNPQHPHYPSSFQSRLDDIAQRYPDFAGDFPSFGGTRSHWGGGGGGGGRRAGDWGGGGGRRATGEEFPAGAARFGEEFGFPEEFNERFSQYYPERQQTQSSPPQSTPTVPSSTPPASKPPTHPNTPPINPSSTTSNSTPRRVVDGASPHHQHNNIQQSNTVDLGQPSGSAEGEGGVVGGGGRNQRSMSAPPDSRNSGPAGAKRYVSSVHIPVLQQPAAATVITAGGGTAGGTGGGQTDNDMGTSNSTPQQQQSQTPPTQQQQPQQQNRPNERVIPIHVEGRDEPVIPKHHQANFNTQSSAPSNERLFGQKPTNFTQFLNKNDPQPQSQSQTAQEDLYRQQQADYQRQQQAEYQKQQQANYQQQQKANQQQQTGPGSNVEQQQEEEVLPRPQIVKPSPLEMIQSIQKDVSSLMMQVERFNGKPRDKEYIYLDEMLTRNLLKLDNIETEGKDTIRQARKEAIKCIESCIGVLEAKANANKQQAEEAGKKASSNEGTVEQKQVGQGDVAPSDESMMVSGVIRSGSSKSNVPKMGEEVKKSDSKVMETSQE